MMYSLQQKLDENRVVLSNLTDLEQNMLDYLGKKDTICYESCNKMNINFDSTINYIMLKNCKNINLTLSGLVVGLDIEKSESINIICKENSIGNILIDHSIDIKINLPNKDINKTYFDINKSKSIKIQDQNGKILNKLKV